MEAGPGHVSAWYVDPIRIEPVKTEQFNGSVADGGNVNFRNIYFNPHGHGTHTECVGHIAKEWVSINQQLRTFFAIAAVITVSPEKLGDDGVITRDQLDLSNYPLRPSAVIIRTVPNEEAKRSINYSSTNPPYLAKDAAVYLRDFGIEHLLIDLPSVDREEDEGVLASHHAFWNYPNNPRLQATISELIYVPNEVADGNYLLNLQIAPFENDATPSKPVIYKPLNLD